MTQTIDINRKEENNPFIDMDVIPCKPERDMAQGYEEWARKINKLLWKGRPGRSKMNDVSVPEFQNFLVQMQKDLWKHHNEAVDYLRNRE